MDDVCFYYPIKLNQELENHVIPLSLGKCLIDSAYFWSDVSASILKCGQTVIQSRVPAGREGAAAKDTNDAIGEETDRQSDTQRDRLTGNLEPLVTGQSEQCMILTDW